MKKLTEDKSIPKNSKCQLILDLALILAYAFDRSVGDDDSIVKKASSYTKEYIPIPKDFNIDKILTEVIDLANANKTLKDLEKDLGVALLERYNL